MKKTCYFITVVLTVAVTVLSGCETLFDGSRKVKFTAVSKSSPATKTAYGDLENGYQMINWVSGDKIRVYAPADGNISGTPTPSTLGMDYVYADYSLTNIRRSGHLSNADLENVDPNGLTWVGDDAATFYAAYPYGTSIAKNASDQLRFVVSVPAGNGDSPAGTQTGAATMVENLSLLAVQSVANGGTVNLEFYPAFSTFEFHLKTADVPITLQSVEFSTRSGGTNEYLTGNCYYDLNLLSDPDSVVTNDTHFLKNTALHFSSGKKSIKILLNNTEIGPETEAVFTIFTLPCAVTMGRITVSYTVDGTSYTKFLDLNKTVSGTTTWVNFPAGHKAVITGLALSADIWYFRTITLNGQVVDWVTPGTVTVDPNESPQSNQFNVAGDGVYNIYQTHTTHPDRSQYRQHWVIPEGKTATVSFKILTPTAGTYEIVPQGDDIDAFTITGPLTGSLTGPTQISFTVKPNTPVSGTPLLWFKTYVTNEDGITFSLDSETQLYDIRGYHYFRTDDPLN